MRCFNEQTITELAMGTVLKEALPEKHRGHLENCPDCRQALDHEIATAQEIARAIRTASPNPTGPCLNDNDLTEFIEGCPDHADQLRIDRHLASCPECVTSLAELDALLHEADSALSPVRYAIRLAKKGAEILAKPDKGFRLSLHEYVPTLKDATGAHEVCAWTQNIDGHPLHFKLQNGNGEQVHLTLAVESRSMDLKTTTVTLRRDGDLIQSEFLGDDGTVRLPNLQRGVYAFEIQSQDDPAIRVEVDLQ